MENLTSAFNDLESLEFSLSKKAKSDTIDYIGGSKTVWPLDIRVLVNVSDPVEKKPYHETHIHECILEDKYIRIPCFRSAAKTCPICDAHWENRKAAEELAQKGGTSESSQHHLEWKKASTLANMFKQQRRFSVLANVRGSPTISILEAKPALTKAIFGDKEKNKKGALDDVRSYGASLFTPSEPTGWITLNKHGKGLDTVYEAKACVTEKVTGRSKSFEITSEPLHPSVVEKLERKPEELPKLKALFLSRMWSEEEMENYVASGGTHVPARVLPQNAFNSAAPKSAVVSYSSPSVIEDTFEDPF